MTAIDIDHLQRWVGKTTQSDDMATPSAVARFRATLGEHLFADDTGTVPLGFHWTLFAPEASMADLGEDGHPARGDWLPDIALPSRMWAGGALNFHAPLPVGARVHRVSEIRDVALKSGTTGELVFVTIDHHLSVDGDLVIEETQSIVYKQASRPSPMPEPVSPTAGGVGFCADTRLLFRYSALTFNAHRIHYDAPYATTVEGYPGLVVHGPLQATLLMNLAAKQAGSARLSFSYRGRAPLYVGQAAKLHVEGISAGRAWVETAPAIATMRADFARLSDQHREDA